MTKNEALALDLALAALKELVAQTEVRLFAVKHDHVALQNAREAIAAIKQARSAPVQEPVAFFYPGQGFYWAKPTKIIAPVTVDVKPLPLYINPPVAQPEAVQELVATKDWEGAEYWMPLAWELCAEECGEDACNELIWEGGPIPEPWGDRWLKYEDEAKRLIALVQKHTTQPAQQDAKRYRYLYDLTCRVGVDSELVRRLTYNQAHLDALIEDTETARSSKENT